MDLKNHADSLGEFDAEYVRVVGEKSFSLAEIKKPERAICTFRPENNKEVPFCRM